MSWWCCKQCSYHAIFSIAISIVDDVPIIVRRPDVEPDVVGDTVTVQIGNPDVVVGIGQTVRVVCNADGSDVDIAWYGPDGTSAGTGNTLTITDFGSDEAGEYTCEATNNEGKDSEPITAILGGRVWYYCDVNRN